MAAYFRPETGTHRHQERAYCPERFYRRRHKIENFFCRIKDWRRIATR